MLAAFFLLLIPVFNKPFIGVALWLWAAMFFPSAWVYGPAQLIRYNFVFSIITILGVFAYKKRAKVEANALTILITLFFIWSFITFLTGQGAPALAEYYLLNFLKIVALYYCAAAVLVKKIHVDFFIWSILLSVGFFASVEGLKVIASGGASHISGLPGHVLGDRNDLAMGINLSIPLVAYLREQYQNKILKLGLLVVMLLMAFCVLGTYSRGGLVGLLVLGILFLMESDKKILVILSLLFVVFIGNYLMPPEWFIRMETINSASEDGSFMGRVIAWKIATLIALDNPIFGAGIKGPENLTVWLPYALELNSKLTGIDTPPPDLLRGHAAHNSFFQVLGEQGFPGLILFVLIILVSFNKLNKAMRFFPKNSSNYYLAKMLKLSLIMYLVSAVALSKAYFDLSFSIYALVRFLDRQVKVNNSQTIVKSQLANI